MTLRIVVVGTSAGGMGALKRLVAQLPHKFPAAVFVVQHMSPDSDVLPLIGALRKAGNLPVIVARDNAKFSAGHVYIAPPDQHLLIMKNTMRVTKGARENRSRPGIDPLFRSAAVAHRNKVVGVVLTGYLDDGTAGLVAIHRCGGICVVQDPRDAAYPDMPLNALNGVAIDHTVALADMGPLLFNLVSKQTRKLKPVPKDVVTLPRFGGQFS